MNNTSLKQKLVLAFFGIFLALVLLEFGLRVAGWAVLYLQERHNHLSLDQNEYRILCLGESTTALGGEDSYPDQLEVMLNSQNPQRKFTVINKGLISTTSDYILAHLDQNLDMYKPQLVIVMMGINDKAYLHDLNKSLWREKIKLYLTGLKVYKLLDLLYQNITHRAKNINNPADTTDLPHHDNTDHQLKEYGIKLIIVERIDQFWRHLNNSVQFQNKGQMAQARQERQLAGEFIFQTSLAYIELAQCYRHQGSLQEAQSLLEQAAKLTPNSPDLFEEMGELYLAQKKSSDARKAFQAVLDLEPNNSDAVLGMAHAYHQEHNDYAVLAYVRYLQIKPQDYWGHIELAQWLSQNKEYNLAQEYLGRAISISSDFEQAYVDLAQILDDQGQYDNEEAFLLKAISNRPKIPRLYKVLGQFYKRQGRHGLAREYFQKEAQQEMAEYYPVTLVNYSLVLDKILSRHIKVVVMQYPLRNIGPLKDYLGQKNGVTFVENRQNFKLALSKEKYNYYFKDNFAFNFGHCTRAGNELIARQLTEVILKNE